MNTIIQKNENMMSRTIKKVLAIDTAVLKTFDKTSCEFQKSKSYKGAIKCATNCKIKNKLKNILNPLDSADFIFEVPQKIYKALCMKVLHVDFPKQLYNVSAKMKNNYFWIEINNDEDEKVSHKIEVETGTYTICKLVSSINNSIREATGEDEQLPVEFDYDCKTNRVTITFNKDKTRINFGQNTCSLSEFEAMLGWMLGFRVEKLPIACVYTAEDGDDATSTIISAEAAPEIEIPYLYISVNDYNRNNNDVYSTTVNRESNILAKIPLVNAIASCKECCEDDDDDDCDNKIIDVLETKVNETFFDIMNRQREYFSPINVDKLEIQFLDRFERVMDFGENTINCVIEFECLYS